MNSIPIVPPGGSNLSIQWPGKNIPSCLPTAPMTLSLQHGEPHHQLFLSDSKKALLSLLPTWERKIDLIYLDPPFASQANYYQRLDSNTAAQQYGDHWKETDYLQFMFELLLLLRMLLSDQGTLYLHCDHHQSHHLRIVLNEVFGANRFLNHIIWSYKTGGIPEKKGFSKKHDDILVYTKTDRPIFNRQYQRSYVASLPEPHTKSGQRLGVQRDEHCSFCETGTPGPKYRQVVCRDVWADIPTLFRNNPERTDYPTQKPQALLNRIIRASSTPNSIVLDPFCGSGTTAVSAHLLGRKSIAIDQNPVAIQTTINRLYNHQASFHRYQPITARWKKCTVQFQQKASELHLVHYHNPTHNTTEAQKWIKSILIDTTGDPDSFTPNVIYNTPVPLRYSIPEGCSCITIEVVDFHGAVWKETLLMN